jgi:hypothetical protein
MDVYIGQTEEDASWFADITSGEITAEAASLLDDIIASDNSSRSNLD